LDFSTEKEWEHWEYEKNISWCKISRGEKIELFCFGTELENPIAKRPNTGCN
jgi:hypothetical protein